MLSERAKRVWAQGWPGCNSKRSSQQVSNAPQFLVKAQGPYVWDNTGKKYIDFIGSLGTIILGHNHPKVTEAVQVQLSTGLVIGSMPSVLEIETAELIQEIFPAMERVRFLANGSDATDAAVRIARAHTDKDKVLSYDYHGSTDLWVSLTPPAFGVKDNFKIYQSDGIETNTACVILEPITLDVSEKQKDYLYHWSKVCEQEKSMLVFDEIITGCRVPSLSVHKWWNLKPDLVALGKAIGNGYPISCIGGKKEVMNSKEYFISKTHSGNTIALAACKATLTELKLKNSEELFFYAQRFQNKFNEICKNIGVSIQGYGTRGSMDLTNPKVALFCQEALKAGMLFGKAFFFNFSHLENHIEDYIFDLIFDIVSSIQSGKVSYEGDLPIKPFVR